MTNPGGDCWVESQLEFDGNEEYDWLDIDPQTVEHYRFTSNRAQTGYLRLTGCVGDRFLLRASPAAALSSTPPPSQDPTPVTPDPEDPTALPPSTLVVLGSASYKPNGSGWGTAHPRKISNSGRRRGLVKKIRWEDWGRGIASGRGKTWAKRRSGGYFKRRVRIKLRASRIGTCPGSSARTYTKLMARVQRRPGGRFRKWSNWAGDSSICGR